MRVTQTGLENLNQLNHARATRPLEPCVDMRNLLCHAHTGIAFEPYRLMELGCRESEMGDGEDIGSDLDGDDDEEEEDEDGGFVVPDGYGSDDCDGEVATKSKKRKLEQVLAALQFISPCSPCGLSPSACACTRAVCICWHGQGVMRLSCLLSYPVLSS